MLAKYNLVIKMADDGKTEEAEEIWSKIMDDRLNKILLQQISTAGCFSYEYFDRKLLSHNHRGGVLFSVETPQEAAKCMNLGIFINGKKHRVHAFTPAQADDLCFNCSTWGHLERNCRAGTNSRCSECSANHRSDKHFEDVNGTKKKTKRAQTEEEIIQPS